MLESKQHPRPALQNCARRRLVNSRRQARGKHLITPTGQVKDHPTRQATSQGGFDARPVTQNRPWCMGTDPIHRNPKQGPWFTTATPSSDRVRAWRLLDTKWCFRVSGRFTSATAPSLVAMKHQSKDNPPGPPLPAETAAEPR